MIHALCYAVRAPHERRPSRSYSDGGLGLGSAKYGGPRKRSIMAIDIYVMMLFSVTLDAGDVVSWGSTHRLDQLATKRPNLGTELDNYGSSYL